MKWVAVLGIVAASLLSMAVQSAEIYLEQTSGDSDGLIPNCKLVIQGSIVQGDAQALERIFQERPIEIFFTQVVELDSPGGSVTEAIELSRLLNAQRLSASVPAGNICSSACALIYLSAPFRYRLGQVSLHRPYFDVSAIHPSMMDDFIKRQYDAISSVRDYLMARGVSARLTDKMMNLPSNAAYSLTPKDDYEIGLMSPMVEELSIQRCGLNNRDVMRSREGIDCAMFGAMLEFKNSAYLNNYGSDIYMQAAGLATEFSATGRTFNLMCRKPL